MITIALDEQGDFENLKSKLDKEPVFIGGVIYDDCGDHDDYITEKERLQKYLKSVCTDSDGVYPKDLHFSSDGESDNSQRVKETKTLFGKTIKEFLEDGTWYGYDLGCGERKGKYYIFASLRGENGKAGLLASNISEAVREDYASNLYVHMAEDVVERILFYNPVITDIDQVRFDLATRRIILQGEERTARMKEYEKLGFEAVRRSNQQDTTERTEYLLTNPANYRTAIEREMLRCGKNTLMIDRIGVKSIYYNHPTKGMDFLYLADAICSYLSFKRKGNTESEWIEAFDELSEEINGKQRNLIWGYDEADEYFDMSLRALEEGDYYTALSLTYDGMKCGSSMRGFYEKKWYPLISDAVINDGNVVKLTDAIRKFKDSLTKNNIYQDKLVYIFGVLENAAKQVTFKNRREEAVLYDLYDAGVSAYTHIGDAKRAKDCFEKTRQYAEYVATEVYLRTRNRMVVFLCDMFEYQTALSIADENVKYHELLSDMKKQIFQNEKYESLNHAIALSQRAQIYAFMEDERAEEDFLKALDTMDPETPDRLITESYLLHYYLSAGMKDKYEQMSKEYFGGVESLADRFDYLVTEGVKPLPRFSLKFALYVYIKALYKFYTDEIPDELFNKLMTIEKSITDLDESAARQINGHPWEIVYKYLAFIMLKHDNVKAANVYIDKIREFADHSEGIIRNISLSGLMECGEDVKPDGKIPESGFTYMYT